jgi:uncharacterized protein (TIGR02246 family)
VRKLLLTLALMLAPIALDAQAANDRLAQRIQQLEDRAALKALVDTFSVLADRKDVQRQLLLFTEDATVSSISGGRPGSVLTGHKQIGDAFSAYLATFETVYHINGQQTVTITGDRATGVAYCLVVLIGVENGKRIKSTSGVIYNDEYVRRDGRWLIAKRTSNFTYRDPEEMAQQ